MGKEKSRSNSRIANVLVADDNQEFLHILERRIKKMGHIVDTANDGIEAIEKIKENEYDLLIVDYSMPGETGLGVIQKAKEMHKSMQIIVVTGSDSIDIAVEALRFRVFDFLRKPLSSLSDFEETVTQALEVGFSEEVAAQEIQETIRLAITEPLTGLRNRHKLEDVLKEEIESALASKSALSVMMLDLDDFKQFNDIHGHVAGDEALKIIGEVIQVAIRKEDIPFRYGGDEFMIILPGTGSEEAEKIAERIIYLTSHKDVGGEPLYLSIGISEWNSKIKSDKDLIKTADEALYKSKENNEFSISIAK